MFAFKGVHTVYTLGLKYKYQRSHGPFGREHMAWQSSHSLFVRM